MQSNIIIAKEKIFLRLSKSNFCFNVYIKTTTVTVLHFFPDGFYNIATLIYFKSQ